MASSETDMSRARAMGQVQKATRAESLRHLAMGKTGKREPYPQGNLTLVSTRGSKTQREKARLKDRNSMNLRGHFMAGGHKA